MPEINQQFQNTVTLASSSFKNIADQSSQIIQNHTQIFRDTTEILQDAASSLTQLTTNLAGLTTIYSDIVNSLQDTKESLKNTTNSLQDTKEGLKNTTNSLNDCTDQNGQLVAALSNIVNRIQNLIDNNKQNMLMIADQLQENIKTLGGTTQSFNSNTSQITNQLQKDIQTLGRTTQSFSSNTSQITRNLDNYTGQVQIQNNKLQNFSDQIATYINQINEIHRDFTELLQLLRSSQNP